MLSKIPAVGLVVKVKELSVLIFGFELASKYNGLFWLVVNKGWNVEFFTFNLLVDTSTSKVVESMFKDIVFELESFNSGLLNVRALGVPVIILYHNKNKFLI